MYKLSTSDLPSKGINYNIETIDISPVNFKYLLEYSKKPANTFIQRLLRDMDLLKTDNLNFNEISYYDFDAILLIKKLISITSSTTVNFTYECKECGEKVSCSLDVDKLDYPPVDENVYNIRGMNLSGDLYKISIPSLDRVYKTAELFNKYNEDIDPILFHSCCILDNFNSYPTKYKKLIENVTSDEIVLLDLIHKLFDGGIKYVKNICTCGNEEVVAINLLATDMFRCLKDNQEVPWSKIKVE